MPARFLSHLLGAAAVAPVPPADPIVPPAEAPSEERVALIAEAMRIRAEMRERIGVEKLRVLHRMITGKDPE